jgi:protein-disulfide isomerase
MKNLSINWLIYALVFVLIIILSLIFLPRPEKKLDNNDIKYSPIEIKIDQFDIIDGTNQAKLAIIIYENYLDPFSYQLQESLKQINEEFSDDLLFIYRPFIGQELKQQQASLLVICAEKYNQGKRARELIYEQGRNNFSLDDLNFYNTELSLNNQELINCINNQENIDLIKFWQDELQDRDIIGSPTIIINDEIITGARPYYDFFDSNDDFIEGLRSIIIRHLNN